MSIMNLFKKNLDSQDTARGSVINENYVPASLPKHGALADFITSVF